MEERVTAQREESRMEKRTVSHFETLRQDTRDEVKRRIEQRDKYSIQLSLALAALLAVAFSTTGINGTNLNFRGVLIAVPLVSIYFTVLILYSYRVHSVLSKYLREEIEPELARLYGIPIKKEWETYYYWEDYDNKKKREVPGIRKRFFLAALLW